MNGICFDPFPGNGPTDPDAVRGSKGDATSDSASQAEVAATPVQVTITVLIPLSDVHPGVDVLTEPSDGNGGGVDDEELHVSVGAAVLFGAVVFLAEPPVAGGRTTVVAVVATVVGAAVVAGEPSARVPGALGAPLSVVELPETQALLVPTTAHSAMPNSAVLP